MAPALISDSPDAPSSSRGAEQEKPTVYLLDDFHPEVIVYCKRNFNAITRSHPDHGRWREEARYLLVRGSRLTAADIASCPNLRAIGKQGVGIDKIDAGACAARDIPILNTPGVNARAVAELVLALATAVARQVGSVAAKQAVGKLVPKEACSGLLLHRKTVGILGMGNIGRAVANIFRGAFEADVVAYDPFLPSDAWADTPHARASSVEQVLASSDVVTVHMPLTPETRGLISYAQMQAMRRTAILINTARGGIIHEGDLERALAEGLVWGAGLDCHEEEPPSKERYGRLWELGVVSTPHIGAATAETQVQTGMRAAERVLEFAMEERNTAKT